MKIIVGLGNPGRDYVATRHNVGFMVIDEIARHFARLESRTRFRSLIAETVANGEKLVLVKPQTYMNLSGSAIREIVNWYKLVPAELLVVADDIDLPFGAMRMRPKGSSGGHNGLRSIIADLQTDEVPRLRIGVGRGPGQATRQVLSRFNRDEEEHLPGLIRAAADCAVDWLELGIIGAMNRCNRKPDAGPVPSLPSTADPEG